MKLPPPEACTMLLRKRVSVQVLGTTRDNVIIESVADAGVFVHDEYIPKKNGGKFKNLDFLVWEDIDKLVVHGDQGEVVLT